MGLDEKIEKTVNEKILELIEKKAIKKKTFRYPFGKKVSKSQRKKNYVTVQIINENGVVDFRKYQIVDQTLIHEDIPRLASAGYILQDKKGNPLIILPNYSVEPFNIKEDYKDGLTDGSNKNGYKLLLNRMELNATDSKKKMGGAAKWIIGIVVAAIIIYALVSGGAA